MHFIRGTTVRLALLGAAAALAHAAAYGATIRRLNFDALVARSELVVHARVVGTRSFWDTETRTIWTATELRVLDSAKGSAGRSLIVTEPGGVLGNVGHLFPGIPQFTANEEVVVFLHSGPGNRLRVTGLRQGIYAVTTDASTGQSIARPTGRTQAEAVHEQGSRSDVAPRPPDGYRLVDFLQEIRQRAR